MFELYIKSLNHFLTIFRLGDAKLYGNASEAQTAMYDRDNPRYPYKSHGQWLKACYGLVSCLLLVTFNGVGAFLEKPFDVRRFIASYISVSAYMLLLLLPSLTHLGPCIHTPPRRLQNRKARIQIFPVGTGKIKRSAKLYSSNIRSAKGSIRISR
jgi:hypothetical protein